MQSRVVSIIIARPWHEIYEAIWRPDDFSKWASGLSAAALTEDGGVWRGEGSDGPIVVRFTPHNDFGILDHWVQTESGTEIYIPIRVIANGSGAEVQLTLFRQPNMTDEQFAADADWVGNDLQTLKRLFEG